MPERGDFIWLDFNPQTGKEQAKKRPALVISPKIYNAKSSLSLVLPITGKYRGWGFEIPLPRGLKTSGSILVDQVKSLDFKARNPSFIENCPKDILKSAIKKLQLLIEEGA
ncbi:MAG: type II toxin-antitoxin system PemK/MazF family toxin [Alphaproteobacteria bacterium]|nr:type II toxin-antitoxin system PemK/MazF family toxin [Alphaproteobacteria bacterium]